MMNQVTPTSGYRDAASPAGETTVTFSAASRAEPAQRRDAKEEPLRPGTPINRAVALSDQDAKRLQTMLVQGESAVARRSDLVELHKRVVTQFSTLRDELSAAQAKQAEADRAAIAGRLGTVETSINQLEGALRIELEPALRTIVADALKDHTPKKTGWARSFLVAAVLIGGGIALGTVFSEDIGNMSKNAAASVSGTANTSIEN